jgi:DNA polymerase I
VIQIGSRTFRAVTTVDFEYGAAAGERQRPICMVARDFETGMTTRLWEEELRERRAAPYPSDRDSLVVAYYASAELQCHIALDWPLPVFVVDLYFEFRNHTNGMDLVAGRGLLGACAHFGIATIDADSKGTMRDLALRGGPWAGDERDALLRYCESDVVASDRLLRRMLPVLDGDRALLRGRYARADARMVHAGVPIDRELLLRLRHSWDEMKSQLVERIDRTFQVYEGTSFREKRFARWLAANGVPWPRRADGKLALDDASFKLMAKRHPVLRPLHELRVSLSKLRLNDLAVGHDGRNRTMLSAFGARSGRNTPSSVKYVFGPSAWLRGLVKPEPGMGLAVIDWAQQEFAVAGVLSQDPAMLAAYESGDPYLQTAKFAGAIPADGTRDTHGAIRDLFKTVVLGVQYGMEEQTLADRINRSRSDAHHLLEAHRRAYRTFWKWSDGAVNFALLRNHLDTVFGWRLHVGRNVNVRSLRNYPMQSNGSEMLRLALCLTSERGISVVGPIHDAIVIEAPADQLDDAVAQAQHAMADASSAVLGGYRIRSEAKLIRYPERYASERGAAMWWEVQAVLATLRPDHQVGHQRPTSSVTSADPSHLIPIL